VAQPAIGAIAPEAAVWLEAWLSALLADPRLDEVDLRVAVALLVLALRRGGLTSAGFNVDADKDDLARVAGLHR